MAKVHDIQVMRHEDWQPYVEEIRSLYVDQDWGLKDVMRQMESERGLVASPKQYKNLFKQMGWTKNFTQAEWISLGSVLGKRQREGKQSRVMVDGKVAEGPFQKRMKTAFDRYKMDIKSTASGSITGDVKSLRISICTPSPSSSPSPLVMTPTSNLSWTVLDCCKTPSSEEVSADAELSLCVRSEGMSPLDLGDVSNLNRMLWTSNLLYWRIYDLFCQPEYFVTITEATDGCDGESSSPDVAVITTLPTLNRPPSYSWSAESLRVVMADMLTRKRGTLSLLMHREQPDLALASSFELLDLAVCSVINMHWSFMQVAADWSTMIQWFVNPRHLKILQSLLRSGASAMQIFAKTWLRISIISSRYLQAAPDAEYLSETLRHLLFDVVGASSLRSVASDLLWWAAMGNRTTLCRSLIDGGGVLDDGKNGQRSLLAAVKAGHYETVALLLNAGVSPDKYDACGGSCITSLLGEALNSARLPSPRAEAKNIVKLLVEYGADVDHPCWEGLTAVEICAVLSSELYWVVHWRSRRDSPMARLAMAAQSTRTSKAASRALQEASRESLHMLLLAAVAFGNETIVSSLLRSGVRPNYSSDYFYRYGGHHGYSMTICILSQQPIDMAVRQIDDHMVALLLDFGAPLSSDTIALLHPNSLLSSTLRPRLLRMDIVAEQGPALLHAATSAGGTDMIEQLLLRGVDVNARALVETNSEVRRPQGALACAMESSTLAVARFLWDRGAAFERRGAEELAAACDSATDTLEKIQFLLARGADATPANSREAVDDAQDVDHPLERLLWSRENHPGLAALISQLAAAVPPDNPFWAVTGSVMAAACSTGRPEVVELLLATRGGRIDDPHHLCKAIKVGACYTSDAVQLVQLVLRECAASGLDAREAATDALGVAAARGYVDIAILLLEAGADVEGFGAGGPTTCGVDPSPLTPVQKAARFGKIDMVKVLINAGAEGYDHLAGNQNPGGMSPRWPQDEGEDIEFWQFVQDSGYSEKNTQLRKRFTKAIELAEEFGHFHVAELLREHQ